MKKIKRKLGKILISFFFEKILTKNGRKKRGELEVQNIFINRYIKNIKIINGG